jgi:hypothetical protein
MRPSRPPIGAASRMSIRSTARRREVRWLRRLRYSRFHWLSLVHMIVAAQRLVDAAVSAFARRLFPASPTPSRQRSARSRPASRARCCPTCRRTRSSSDDTRRRVRMRTPVGGAATNRSECVLRRIDTNVSRLEVVTDVQMSPRLGGILVELMFDHKSGFSRKRIGRSGRPRRWCHRRCGCDRSIDLR